MQNRQQISNYLTYELRWARLFLLAIFLASNMPLSFAASLTPYSATDVKASYLHKFLFFIDWPLASDGDLKICTINDQEITPKLALYQHKKTTGPSYVVMKKAHLSASITQCDVIYIGDIERKELRALLKRLDNHPILTISDAPNFLENGGMINFIHKDKHILFEINLSAMKHSNLTIRSRLLRAADRVIEGEITGG